MVFSSPIFLFAFLPAFLFGYHLAPRGWRNLFLFLASLFFYAWGEKLTVLVLFGSLVFNYAMACRIDRRLQQGQSAQQLLTFGILTNLGLLIFYKYLTFIVENLSLLSQAVGGSAFTLGFTPPDLPLGVSFFTFQAMSYLLDVHRRDIAAERHFIRFGLYVFLFPHLIAGPIVRYRDLAEQLGDRPVRDAQFMDGIRRFVLGLGKKLLLANPLAAVADSLFQHPTADLAASAAWLGLICYTLQIYFDFSGYSDMAIGLGKLFGFDFLENFRYPYVATSITDFWRRWHLSLSTWFRDYLYIPLGGNRRGAWITYRNCLIVFLLCGLWHGASWCFILWGAWHGLFLILERLGLGTLVDRLGPIRHGYTLLVVMIGWVFFRVSDLTVAGAYFAALAGSTTGTATWIDFWPGELTLVLPIAILAATPIWPTMAKRLHEYEANAKPIAGRIHLGRTVLELAWLSGLFLTATMQMAGSTYSPFIYFRF
ncbi:MBOAT family O-acyltransferase [Tuwongella immobilis]|uniref:MBOAT family protein n=1 Tax=Tuwongella immobilis TaxID=692036 RepID=A0A6C2YJ82_9BACT|nr:MBOAT family protein [Tuwongella immobilis]VIP01424.1 alginate o-acetyltransferase : Alginate O-acetyltransferase OS=Exiguobacterium sp. AB2 GN=DI14_05885 PE=4 SV=1: MBOAT [Tuwongella immobilis]VTR98364.1 alginate o-acetyltransferase : Alginate O-acetyltransferase OS=Exiguobacterium sp. AB2 GN=DI14_05885 PE=4 SV=1: MBOAT [Tuwongella immobilis]